MLHYPATPLSDGTILLRPWTEQDLPALEQASHDPYIPATTSVPSLYTHAEGLKWLERQQQRVLENVGLPFCIADAHTEEPMGFIGLWLSTLSQGRASFGYWIIPNARQRARHCRCSSPLTEVLVANAKIKLVVSESSQDSECENRIGHQDH